MCNSLDFFISTHKVSTPTHNITIPDGRKVLVEFYGDVLFLDNIVLKNVPAFQFNLLSVHKLCNDLCASVILLMTNASFRALQRQAFLVVSPMDSIMLLVHLSPHQLSHAIPTVLLLIILTTFLKMLT